MKSTGNKWSDLCERSWSDGNRMIRHPKWAIGWEHHSDWMASLGQGTLGHLPPSQMVLMGAEEMGAITYICRINFVGDSKCFRSVLSQQICSFTVSQHEVIILIKPLRIISLVGKSKYCLHKAFSDLCKPCVTFKLPTVRLSALEMKMEETEWKPGVIKST